MTPLILAHGDVGFLFILVGVQAAALLSGVIAIAAAARRTPGERSVFGSIVGGGAVVIGGALLLLLGWPRRFSDLFDLALAVTVPIGLFGMVLSLLRRRKRPSR